MMPGCIAHEVMQQPRLRRYHQRTSLLPRVTLNLSLQMAALGSSFSIPEGLEAESQSTTESRQSVGLSIRICVDRKGNREGLHEVLSHQCRAVPDGNKLRTSLPKTGEFCTQTSHLLATEYSAEVTQEYEHSRLVRPCSGQAMRLPFRVEYTGFSQTL